MPSLGSLPYLAQGKYYLMRHLRGGINCAWFSPAGPGGSFLCGDRLPAGGASPICSAGPGPAYCRDSLQTGETCVSSLPCPGLAKSRQDGLAALCVVSELKLPLPVGLVRRTPRSGLHLLHSAIGERIDFKFRRERELLFFSLLLYNFYLRLNSDLGETDFCGELNLF